MITGATAGIGEAAAHKFASSGWDVIVTGRRVERLKELAASIRSRYSADAFPLGFDVRDAATIEDSINSLQGKWQDIDVLVNNAGLALGTEPFHEADLADWDSMFETNVRGLLHVTRHILPLMLRREKGHIINLASIAGHMVYPGGHVYCATKSAVLALTQGMRLDLVSHNIKVSSVSPGATETEFSIVRYKGDKGKADEKYKGYIPLTGEDVAESIYFIASQPDHVNIEEIILQPKAQASAYVYHKEISKS
jgi:NADP-dependent 3-hydroxy acid dehydrogenase YdfG